MILFSSNTFFFYNCSTNNIWLSISTCYSFSYAQFYVSRICALDLADGHTVTIGISDSFLKPDITPLFEKTGFTSEWQNYLLFRHGA